MTDEEYIVTDEEYIAAINKEAVERGYMPKGESLTDWTGNEPWLEAWRDDPTLTPEEQVAEEIHCAAESCQ